MNGLREQVMNGSVQRGDIRLAAAVAAGPVRNNLVALGLLEGAVQASTKRGRRCAIQLQGAGAEYESSEDATNAGSRVSTRLHPPSFSVGFGLSVGNPPPLGFIVAA